MSILVNKLVSSCIKKGYILESRAPWLHYALEKHISTILISIPFLLLGAFISSWGTSISFYCGFSFLRSRTNGFHSNSVSRCFISSLFVEYIFLGVLYQYMSMTALVLIGLLSSIAIFFLAPFNHPNMGLSPAAVKACAQKAKIRLLLIILVCLFTHLLDFVSVSHGLCLSIAMTACLLVFAYIISLGGKKHEYQ